MSSKELTNAVKPKDIIRRYHDFSATKQKRYLKVLEETGNRMTAAASVGVDHEICMAFASRNPTFHKRARQAENNFLAELEAEAKRRAVTGVEKDVWYQGEVVGKEKVYSDKLLETLMKANDPDKYGNKSRVDTTTTINVNDTTLRSKLASALGVELKKAPTPIEDDAIDGEVVGED